MIAGLILLLITGILFFLNYLPEILLRRKAKKAKSEAERQFVSLTPLYRKCVYIDTKPRGTGTSQNSETRLENVHTARNQAIAVRSVLNLIRRMRRSI